MERSLLNNSPDEDDMEPLFTGNNRSQHRRAKNYMTGVFVAIVCVVIVASIVAAAGKLTGIHEQPSFVISVTPIVNTTCGFIQGQQEDAVFVFRGMRYAAPPTGELRWQAPRSLQDTNLCWTSHNKIYKANNFQSSCYQYDPIAMRQGGSEDCLFVNVWTPQLEHDAMLDVMVYIHGGGLMVGSGNIEGETPTPEISKNSNSVFVSFNYRLNVFGFMALEELSWKSPEGVSGNYGLRDQVQLLKWVRDNIQAFGGNPNSVTIFGPDGGSASVLALMASPEATGLFHQAWAMSGLPLINTSLTEAQLDNRPYLKHCNCHHSTRALTLTCLHGLTAQEVMEAFQWHDHPSWEQNRDRDLPTLGEVAGGILVIDGLVIPLSPLDALRADRFNDVPLLVGNMAQAIDDHPQPKDLLMWTWQIYDHYLSRHLDVFSPNLSAHATQLYPHHITPEYQFTSMVTDIRYTCPTNQMATMMASMMRSPVLRYIGMSRPSEPVKNEGVVKSYAFCGWDVLSYFGLAKHYVDDPSKQDRLFMINLRNMLAALSPIGRATLRQYPEVTYLVSEIVTQVSKYNDEACQLWFNSGLYPLAVWQM